MEKCAVRPGGFPLAPPENFQLPEATQDLPQLIEALQSNTKFAQRFADSAATAIQHKLAELAGRQTQLRRELARQLAEFRQTWLLGRGLFNIQTDLYQLASNEQPMLLTAFKNLNKSLTLYKNVVSAIAGRGDGKARPPQPYELSKQAEADPSIRDEEIVTNFGTALQYLLYEDDLEKVIDYMFPKLEQGVAALPDLARIKAYVKRVKLPALVQALQNLEALSGREEVKNAVAYKLENFADNWRIANTSHNHVITGPAGSGKSMLAEFLGRIYAASGLLLTDKFTSSTRADFVGQYLGQTAPKTLALLNDSYEGVLFLDEAYDLTRYDAERQSFDEYGLEAVAAMLPFLERNKGNLSMIVAGYYQPMCLYFFGSNEGLERRFPPPRFDLGPYSAAALYNILEQRLRALDADAIIDPEARALFLRAALKYGSTVFNNQASDVVELATMLAQMGAERKDVCTMLQALINFAWQAKRAVICGFAQDSCPAPLNAEPAEMCAPAALSEAELEESVTEALGELQEEVQAPSGGLWGAAALALTRMTRGESKPTPTKRRSTRLTQR